MHHAPFEEDTKLDEQERNFENKEEIIQMEFSSISTERSWISESFYYKRRELLSISSPTKDNFPYKIFMTVYGCEGFSCRFLSFSSFLQRTNRKLLFIHSNMHINFNMFRQRNVFVVFLKMKGNFSLIKT